MKKTTVRRESKAINAGSMADIAFLLLIFFLVTTTIVSDQGILVKLPPYDPDPPSMDIRSRNVFKVYLNADNQLLVRGEEISGNLLKDKVKTFILNPEKIKTLSTKPEAAIVSLIHDRGTNYDAYLSIYNEIKAAYNELWDEMANTKYNKNYTALNITAKKEIRREIPLIISEAEPTGFGE